VSVKDNVNKIQSKPKKSLQGDGKHSKASHGRKKSRGQGKK
jgi:hypothetical protein